MSAEGTGPYKLGQDCIYSYCSRSFDNHTVIDMDVRQLGMQDDPSTRTPPGFLFGILFEYFLLCL